jgi:ABC-type transport system involved in cytochrome bd biosynthesis fused ATPase/permease subunit
LSSATGIEVADESDRLALENITLKTPDGARELQRDLSFEVNEGDSLLLTRPSGAGKTSLMRAVAGIWRYGHGCILRPPTDDILFMPQKPYLILGSLRHQIQYPRAETVDDQCLCHNAGQHFPTLRQILASEGHKIGSTERILCCICSVDLVGRHMRDLRLAEQQSCYRISLSSARSVSD